MPDEWSAGLADATESRIARRVADYIAGMTDTYAVLAHRKLYATTPDYYWELPSRACPSPTRESRRGAVRDQQPQPQVKLP